MIADDPAAPAEWANHPDVGDLAFQLHSTQGFLGHEISVYGRYYNSNNLQGRLGPPFLFGTRQVGPEVEFESFCNDIGCAGGFDFDTFSIEIDESTLDGFESASGNFNGYVFEDTNDTLPDIVSVTFDDSASTRTPSEILFSPNTIWVNDESHRYGPGEFVRLIVTFADEHSIPGPSLTPSTSGSMILEAPTEPGKTYQFERFSDLTTWLPFDLQFVATSPFVTAYLRPGGPSMFYRAREIE